VLTRFHSCACAFKSGSKLAVSGKVCKNSVGRPGKRMDSQRISVLEIETNCHVKLSRGCVEFGG
jgi:hypothetical protein